MMAWITSEWKVKLIALGLALGLWYYAMGEESVEFTRTVPIQIELQNEQMSVLTVSTETLQVTFKAPRGRIADIAGENIYAIHKFGKDVNAAGEYSFRVEEREIKLPSFDMRVVSIAPETVEVVLDEVVTERIPIVPNFLGDPAFGYKVQEDEMQLNPNAILIQGPKGEFSEMKGVKTKPIDLVGRIRSFKRTVELDLPSNIKPLSDSNVDIYVPIREEFGEKDFFEVPIRILRAGNSFGVVELDPAKVSFTLTGSNRLLENLEDNMLVYVDLSEHAIGEHKVPLKIDVPDGVRLKDEEITNIDARISVKSVV